MGAERRSIVMSDQEKKLTAYHEAGHAIVGLSVPEHDPVHKVTIIPRGRALGVTMFLPEGDRYNYTRDYLESKISSLFGGRLAEEIIFGNNNVTTGASNDIKKATEIARNMVTKWGLSEKVGPLTLGGDDEEVFLGHSITRHKEVSEATSSIVDAEVRSLIDRNYKRAEKILRENIEKLHAMAEALIKYETIDVGQIKDVMEGRPPAEPASWRNNKDNNANGKSKNTNDVQDRQTSLKLDGNVGTAPADGSSSIT
jgi:cell division protease FtsH